MPLRNQEMPLPGFPRIEKFKSKEEVDSYYAGEKIQCLLCGRWFKWINGIHLRHVHGISSDDYKEMYGLPWGRGLLGTLAYKNKAKQALRLRAEGKLKNPPGEFRKAGITRLKPLQPYQKDLIIKQGLLIHGKTRQYRREDFQRILERMRNENRLLKDVCGDPDMPSKTALNEYVTKHPDLKEQIHKIHHSQSYSFQARTRDFSPRFSIDCQRLRARGESAANIATALDVTSGAVLKVLKETSPDFRSFRDRGRPPKWQFKDYEAILVRMRDQQRGLVDVCGDPDFPSIESVWQLLKKSPEFKKQTTEIQHNLPYHMQVKTGILSPRFTIDCLRLRANGMSIEIIGRALGCSGKPVGRVLRDNPDSGLPTRLKPGKKSRRKDYEAVVERMRSQQRAPRDVCNDKDLPCYQSWYMYKKKHPEFVEEYLQVLWSLPIHVQLKTRTLSPELLARVQRMHSRGMTRKEIANELGVNIYAVNRFFNNIRKAKST